MRVLAIITVVFLAVALLTAAKQSVDFLDEAQFSYGMSITDADRRLADGDKDFVMLYRVDTPSTIQFACTYKETEFYTARFYQGVCFYIERRSETDATGVESIFRSFSELHGETPDSTRSRDQHLWYSHWMMRDRDVELTASQRDGEIFIVTFEEYDPLVMGEALSTLEQEVGNTTYEIDPLTGKPRPSSHPQEGDESAENGDAEQEASDDDGGEDDEDPPPEDDDDDNDDFDY
jgi:hypothetical protein